MILSYEFIESIAKFFAFLAIFLGSIEFWLWIRSKIIQLLFDKHDDDA